MAADLTQPEVAVAPLPDAGAPDALHEWVRGVLANPKKAALVAALLGVLVHLNALGNGFAYDDAQVIQANDSIHTLKGLWGALFQPYWPSTYGTTVGMWRPVVTGVFGLEWAVFGGSTVGYHLVTVLLHAVATALVVLFLARLLPAAAAAIGGLIFAVHPVHVEAVANLVGTAEILTTLFFVGACIVHLDGGERYGWGRSLAVAGLFALGMLSKESAIVLPAALFLVDAARRDLSFRDLPGYVARRWPVYLAIVLVAAGLLWGRLQVLGGIANPQLPAGAVLWAEIPRVWTIPNIWPHYVRLLIAPFSLAADYANVIPVSIGWGARNLTGVAIALLSLALGLITWRQGRPLGVEEPSSRAVGFAVVWFGITIVTVANIFFISPVLVAERNLYLPSVGAVAAAGCLIVLLHRHRQQAAVALAFGVLAVFSLRTWTRNPAWNDTETVMAALLEEHPENGRAWIYRGNALMRERRFPDARRAWSAALGQLDSDYSVATEVAARLISIGDPGSLRAAEFLLERAWRDVPEWYTAPGYLAALYLNTQRYAEAERAAKAAVARESRNSDTYWVLGASLSALGRPAEAIPARLQAIRNGEEMSWQRWIFFARDYAAVGDSAETRMVLDSARARVPAEWIQQVDSVRAELLPAPAAAAIQP